MIHSFYAAAGWRTFALSALILTSTACSSKAVREEPSARDDAKSECEAFVTAMDRCVGRTKGGAETVSAMRASLSAPPGASDEEVLALKKRCVASRAQLHEACK